MNRSNTKTKVLNFVIANKALLILIVVCIFVACLTDKFFTFSNLMNVLRQNCAAIILGVGFTYVVASASIDLSVGTMVSLVGVVTAFASRTAIPFILVLVLAILFGALLGAANGAIITRFGIQAFIVTLAMQSVFKGVTYLVSSNKAVTNISDEYTFMGQGYIGAVPFQIYFMILILIIGIILMNKTKFGRRVLAIGGNEIAANVCGIDVKKMRFMVHVLMGICVAFAAVLITGRAGSAQPTAGQGMEMDVIAAVVIGGTPLEGGEANVLGTAIGCLIVGVINNGLNLLKVDSNWQIVCKGILILAAVLFDVASHKFLAKGVEKKN